MHIAAHTPEQTQQRLEQDCIQHAATRNIGFQNRCVQKIGTKTSDILTGRMPVYKLSETPESIGEMIHVCEFCGAYKFKSETSSLCCLKGKVELTPFHHPTSSFK